MTEYIDAMAIILASKKQQLAAYESMAKLTFSLAYLQKIAEIRHELKMLYDSMINA